MGKVYSKYVLIGIITVLTLTLIGISYAYWRGSILGEGANIAVTIDEAHIIFTDDTEIADNNAKPGWSTSKTFTIENQGTTDFRYDIYIKDFVNTLVTDGYFQYKITSTNGYNMSEFEALPKSSEASNYDLATGINVSAGVIQEYTIEFRYLDDPDIDQSEDMGANFSGQLMIEAEKSPFKSGTLARKILDNATTISTRTDFDSVFGDETPTTGVLYKESVYRETPESTGSENNNKDVYYFAGNVADNWVEFGGYMWRIIRTNEDGSVRLLYHRTSTTATSASIEGTAYNSKTDSPMYAGYMYGTTETLTNHRKNTTSSEVKTRIDRWYKINIFEKSYDEYVSKTAIYCNDRAAGAFRHNGVMYFAATSRLANDQTQKRQPTYQCGQNSRGGYYDFNRNWTILDGPFTSSRASVADRFSVSVESGGNGQLEYPIALMTADEVSFAGGKYGETAPNTYYYLNSSGESSMGSKTWWLMSPYSYGTDAVRPEVFCMHGSNNPGNLAYMPPVVNRISTRPVLSLKSCVEWESGDGTAESPYTVSVSDTCSVAVN